MRGRDPEILGVDPLHPRPDLLKISEDVESFRQKYRCLTQIVEVSESGRYERYVRYPRSTQTIYELLVIYVIKE